MVKVAGMASRLVRRTAIACGVAAISGAGIGFAVGEPVQADDILPARTLPADLCARLGDVSGMLPQPSKPVTLTQGGTSVVTCEASTSLAKQRTFSSAAVKVTITPYAGKDAGAGQEPLTPAAVARRIFDRTPMDAVPDRPYRTKASRTARGVTDESWVVKVLVQREDITVQVDYTAFPVEAKIAEQAALVLADRAIWEAK